MIAAGVEIATELPSLSEPLPAARRKIQPEKSEAAPSTTNAGKITPPLNLGVNRSFTATV